MIITAFDLATATGVVDGSPNGKPRLWSWFLADGGPTRPARLLHLRGFLCRYFQQEPCDGVVYEKPMPLGMIGEAKDRSKAKKPFRLSEDNVAFARGAIGVLEMTCQEFKKPVEGLGVQDARQAVLGWRMNRTNELTKARVVREVTSIFKINAENDNECDAWVLWSYACALTSPMAALTHQPLFGGELRG